MIICNGAFFLNGYLSLKDTSEDGSAFMQATHIDVEWVTIRNQNLISLLSTDQTTFEI